MAKTKLIILAIVAIVIVAVASVGTVLYYQGSPKASPSPSSSPSYSASPSPSTAPSAFPVTVTDDENTSVTINSAPQRIISIAPANTQILYAIGVGAKVVGLTDYDNYPYNFSAWFAAGNMTSIGGYSTPNTEAIAGLNPDLILIDNINDPILPNLRVICPNVLVINPTSVQGVYHDISLIGQATGANANATSVVNSIKAQISGVEATIAAANVTQKPTVYYEVWYDSTGVMTAGSTSWINDIITFAGGVNIFGNVTEQWPSTSSEVIVQKNPDVILVATTMGTTAPYYGSIADIMARPGWNTISAVQNNRICVIDQDLFSEPGPLIGEQVQAVAACIYPQLFNSTS